MAKQIANKTLPAAFYLRLPQVLAIFPVSKSAWWKGIREQRYPRPVKLSERTSAWRAADILELCERKSHQTQDEEKQAC